MKSRSRTPSPSSPDPTVLVRDSTTGAPLCTAGGLARCDGYDNGVCLVTCSDDAPSFCDNTNGGTFTMTVTVSAPDYGATSVHFLISIGACGGTGIYPDAGPSASVELVARCAKPFTHSDGLGDSWTDCTPPGSDNISEATRACGAASSTVCDPLSCAEADAGASGPSTDAGPNVTVVCTTFYPNERGVCTCWAFAGPAAGHVHASNTDCQCPMLSDPTWE